MPVTSHNPTGSSPQRRSLFPAADLFEAEADALAKAQRNARLASARGSDRQRPSARGRHSVPQDGVTGGVKGGVAKAKVLRPIEVKPVPGSLGRLTRLGFTRMAECLLSVPKDYLDFTSPVYDISRLALGDRAYFVLKVRSRRAYDRAGQPCTFWPKVYRLQMSCVDQVGNDVDITVFGNIWPWISINTDEDIHVHGTLQEWRSRLQIAGVQPVPEESRGLIAAVYAGKPGQVSGEALAQGVAQALPLLDEAAVLMLAQAGLRPGEFTEQYRYRNPKALLSHIHRPSTLVEGVRARAIARRMTLETIVRQAASARSRNPVAASAIPLDLDLLETLITELPYKLSKDQRQAVREIVDDLRSAYPMRRLLSGDVGTGKSITFMVPAAAAYAAGADVAVLAPSQLVAEQLAREFTELFPGLPVSLVLAGSRMGEGICIGTTALLGMARKAKRKFDLVIVDEQHKFSVDQKASLQSRHTNVLEATATAIPRSLALVNFGGMDVSILRECPVQKIIETVVVDDAGMPDVHAFIAGEVLAQGGQMAVIYPLVAGAGAASKPSSTPSTEGLESVIGAAHQWERRYPGKVGVLHGRMTAEEKAKVIGDMHAGRIGVLVSSSVIEVGVTLPSLQAMIIESPERYGVSQLHQLRGRLARKGGSGTMFLHAGAAVQDEAMERLRLLEQCSDGFTLAERDMDLRGFGEVEDDSQSQTGATRPLFHGVGLSHKEIRQAAERFGLVV